ncbi:MAG: formylglycine-generating enzyme family protein [Gemmataceae bacterium]
MTRHPSPRLLTAALGLSLAATLLLNAADEPMPKTEVEVTNAVGMKLRRVPAGTITVRITDEDFPDRPAADTAEVKIDKAFYLGSYEVTQEEYEKVVGANPSAFSPAGDNRHRVKGMATKRFPVENVTWYKAKEFCAKLSEMPEEKAAGRAYRLPTGDEWEYAARAGSSKAALYAFGTALTSDQANFNGLVPDGDATKGVNLQRPASVGSYKPNAWGLYDMHGNVWEWTADVYRTKDGKEVDGRKMLRGGSWLNRARDCAASTRLGLEADEVYNNIGFRVVCEVTK